MVEYFSLMFSKDSTFRKDFEAQANMGEAVYGEDVFEWLDRMVVENQKENAKILEELPEKISFTPDRDVEE